MWCGIAAIVFVGLDYYSFQEWLQKAFLISLVTGGLIYSFRNKKKDKQQKWKHKKDNSIEQKDSITEWKKLRESRAQHYLFVHRVLRDYFFESPAAMIEVFRKEDRNDSLSVLWKEVGDDVGESSLVDPDGLCCNIKEYNDITIAIITLPTPQIISEAYFVALVYRPPAPGRDELTRFITMEHSVDTPVLCGWDGTGRHYSTEYQCEPNFDDFFQEVCKICYSDT